MFKGHFSLAIVKRWVYKLLRWTNKKTVSFKTIPSWCQLKKSCDELFHSPEKAIRVCMLFKHDVPGKIFDSNCLEMGVEAIEMD